ncbi:MAG: transposase [Bacteroidota bacterium]|nr:transposase [Odoribacter sp.]MDP3645307.1 transposase [Bacteroidota bacterium]
MKKVKRKFLTFKIKMHFEPGAVYHIYNRSNEIVFHSRENYLFFLKKVKEQIEPFCKILAWILMPNHFHFLVVATEVGCLPVNEKHRLSLQVLPKHIGTLLSSYTQAINKQENRRGKLFSNNTEAKCLNDIEFYNTFIANQRTTSNTSSPDYATICFNYIHQNPVMAGLVGKMEDWEFSSFRDYACMRNGTLIDKELAFQLINADSDDFYLQSNISLDDNLLKEIF